MVGELAAVEPVLPVVRRPDEAVVRLLVRARRRVLAPRQRAERGSPSFIRCARVARGPSKPRRRSVVSRSSTSIVRRLDDGLVVAVAGVVPAAAHAAVVEGRLAVERELHLAVDAAHRAQQDVVGVVVGRRAAVGARALVLVVPGADQQDVADDHPAAAGAPARLEHHRARAGSAAPAGTCTSAGPRRNSPASRSRMRAEHARRVHPRQAHPLDVAARRDQRARLAVREEAVVGDRRERAAREPLSGEVVDHAP